MPQLPGDVFLAIASATDIDTFLAMRLLDHHTHALIDEYAVSISETVARHTFPNQNNTFAELPPPETGQESIRWLRELRYRAQLARGWKVLERLSAIINDAPTLLASPKEDQSIAFEKSKQHHLAICVKQVAYVGSVSFEHIVGYLALRRELQGMFSCSSNASWRFRKQWMELIPRAAASMPASSGAQFSWARWWAPWFMMESENLQWEHAVSALRSEYCVDTIPERHCANVVHRQLAWLQATVARHGNSDLPKHPDPARLRRRVFALLEGPRSPGPRARGGFVAERIVFRDVPYVVQLTKAAGRAGDSRQFLQELIKQFVLLYDFNPRPPGYSARNPPRRDPRPEAAEGRLLPAYESDMVLPEFRKVLEARKEPYAARDEWKTHVGDVHARAVRSLVPPWERKADT